MEQPDPQRLHPAGDGRLGLQLRQRHRHLQRWAVLPLVLPGTIGCKNATGGPSNPNTKSFCGSTMAATLNDPELRTYNRKAAAGSAADIYKHNPWR